jgi:glycosyltransferase involved in cell wall biosynthesis
VRLGLFVDVEYWRDAGGLSTDQPVMRFLLELRQHVDELVLLGRLRPGEGRRPYSIPAGVRFVQLPYYRSVWDVAAVVRAVPGALRSTAAVLPELDVLWVLGPSPVSIALARLARRRQTRLALGVRQDYPAYVRHRLPGLRWLPAVLAARALEAAFQRLSRRVPTVAVGTDLTRRYGSDVTPAFELTILPVTSAELEAATRLPTPTGDRFELLWVGRLDREKGPSTAFDALRLLVERNERKWRLTVAGDGPLEADLRMAAASLGGATRFLGHVPHGPDLFRLYHESNAFVHVSLTEGLPQTVLEAQAFGTPVVATDVGGVRAAVDDGRAGLLVPPGDPSALADAVERLAADPDLAREVAERGKSRAARHTMDLELPRLAAFLEGGTAP